MTRPFSKTTIIRQKTKVQYPLNFLQYQNNVGSTFWPTWSTSWEGINTGCLICFGAWRNCWLRLHLATWVVIKHEKNNDISKPGLENLQGPGFRSVQVLWCPDGFVKKYIYIVSTWSGVSFAFGRWSSRSLGIDSASKSEGREERSEFQVLKTFSLRLGGMVGNPSKEADQLSLTENLYSTVLQSTDCLSDDVRGNIAKHLTVSSQPS